ncbi:NAD(P)-dependent oxidoreductase [Paraburkholderia sp. DHOC27]|uniref:NAD-dependent epimerase/dehydratase family protein n=1 Tax=Paraburkholderia sp. DHOC27 TaxID=2303330 RepID=UPI000E3B7368|nr:NAD-dependent epimerase/dehydratase family protein [Paraburkholderia sp. DHOC27]RFU46017.1 NAD-dependent epimerase/dehydratase family protein [Paraburkholderia sp. DHOC27]
MTATPARFAVTGANGYVGSIIVRSLAASGEVVRMVRHPASATDMQWSLDADVESVARELQQRNVTHLIHAAWDMQANGMDDIQRVCVQGSARLFDAARRAGIEKIIFISTISAYAGARSVYGQAKLGVERLALDAGGVVLRLGLVYGPNEGGVFGSLKQVADKARFVPMIGDGSALQYLLHEDTLADVLRRAVGGEFDRARHPLTIAQPNGIAFRAILRYLASEQGRQLVLIPVPWRVLYAGLKFAETLGLKLNFRSDSVISFVFQNPAPDFTALDQFGIAPRSLSIAG